MKKDILCRYMRPKDHNAVRDLLARNNLPTGRISSCNFIMLVAEQAGRIIGCGGIEQISRFGVLQSLAG